MQNLFLHMIRADAALTGFELSADISILNWLVLKGTYSAINTEFTEGTHEGNRLPLMPPDKATLGVNFLLPDVLIFSSPYFTVNAKFISGKNAAGIYEPFGQFDDGIGSDIPFGVCSTDSYNLLDLNFGFDLNLYSHPININMEITNLLDKNYRDFLDTYKGYSLSPGRSVNLKINVPLDF